MKDLFTCPQKLNFLSEVLNLDGGVNELLVMTQAETIPFLVNTKRQDILNRIKSARPGTDSVETLILEPRRNLASVLARLFVESRTSESAAAALLQESAPGFKGRLKELVTIEPVLTACEILKAAGDCGKTDPQKAYDAFGLLAKLAKSGSSSSNALKGHDPKVQFIDEYILGIMAHFTDIVDNSKQTQSTSEKRRALQAIKHLIIIANSNVEMALPQVRATLQSALQNEDLISEAFDAWTALLKALLESGEDATVVTLIHHTMSIVAQTWSRMDASTQETARKEILQLVKDYNPDVVSSAALIPNFEGIPDFSKLSKEIHSYKAKIEPSKLLDGFALRCVDDNVIVVRQALQELIPFLDRIQELLHENGIGQQPLPGIPALFKALLDTVMRFKEHDEDIVDQCARALGILGCMDSNQVEITREKHNLMILSNFKKLPEVVEFIAHLLENVLVPAFRSAPTGKTQSYLAYVMQELLKQSGITEAVSHRSKGSPPRAALQRWLQIPESVQNTLTPYLNSKYHLSNPGVPDSLPPFPDYGAAPLHATWLRRLVFHLLHMGKGTNARAIFPTISRVIQNHDISIATFMLPFVIQNVVAGSDDPEEIKFISSELRAIMCYNITPLSESEAQNIKQCSEVCKIEFGIAAI